MSPLQIELLLHIAARNERIPGEQHPSQHDSLIGFLDEKVITRSPSRVCGFELTERGEAYVRFLLALPLPVAHWRIPGPLDLAIPQGDRS